MHHVRGIVGAKHFNAVEILADQVPAVTSEIESMHLLTVTSFFQADFASQAEKN